MYWIDSHELIRIAFSNFFSSNEIYTAQHLISKVFQVNKDIGTVTGVTLHYEKTTNLLTGWAYADDWQLMGMAIYNAESETLWVEIHI